MKELKKRIPLKYIYVLSAIIAILLSVGLYYTYAMFTANVSSGNVVNMDTTLKYNFDISGTQSFHIGKNSIASFYATINNTSNGSIYYEIYYSSNSDLTNVIIGEVVEDKTVTTTALNTSGNIDTGVSKDVPLVIANNSNNDIDVVIGVVTGYVGNTINYGTDNYPNGTKITNTYNLSDIKSSCEGQIGDTSNCKVEIENGKKVTYKVKEKRVVTYNPVLAKKQLFEIQKLENKAHELCLSKAKKEEYGECSKYVDFKGKDGSKAKTEINQKKIDEDKKLCGFNLLVTSELSMKKEEIYKTYHNLWRIEESFRIMKSELDARPAFVKTKETIHGHFLICYLSTVLARILQIYELRDEDSMQEIFNFFREFKLVEVGNKYINMATKKEFIVRLKEQTKLPLTNAILSKNQYKKIMDYEI